MDYPATKAAFDAKSTIELYRMAFDAMGATTYLRCPYGMFQECGHGTAAHYLYAINRVSPLAEGFAVAWTGNDIEE